MSKIYMVCVDNGWDYEAHEWWNVGAFTSDEAARDYIEKLSEAIIKAENRIDDLWKITNIRELTDEEKEEVRYLHYNWDPYLCIFDRCKFIVEEYELNPTIEL